MKTNEYVEYVNRACQREIGRVLNTSETRLLVCALEDENYQVVATEATLSVEYIRSRGSGLFRLLTSVLESPTPLTKKQFKKFLDEKIGGSKENYGGQKPCLLGNPPCISKYIYREKAHQAMRGLLQSKKVITIFGWQGTGKSTTLAHELEQSVQFECLSWETMVDCPPLQIFLDSFLGRVNVTATDHSRVDSFLRFLEEQKGLLVLDQADQLLSTYGSEYIVFLQKAMRQLRRGGIVVLSRELSPELGLLAESEPGCGAYQMPRMTQEEAVALFKIHGLCGEDAWPDLAKAGDFNPLILNDKARMIRKFFDGNASVYLNQHPSASSPLLNDGVGDYMKRRQKLTEEENLILGLLLDHCQSEGNDRIPRFDYLKACREAGCRDGQAIQLLQGFINQDLVQLPNTVQGGQLLVRTPILREMRRLKSGI
jgi:hypothetical protein